MMEIIIETEILKKAEKLNLEIFVLFCKLDRYKDKMTDAIYRYMADKLYLLYREEFERMFEPYGIERTQEKYMSKKKREKIVPRESWLFKRKNRAAKHFFETVKQEAEQFFANPAAVRVNVLSEQTAPPTPQTPPEQGKNGEDRKAHEKTTAPKTGKGEKQK